jgi:hypothetical protein
MQPYNIETSLIDAENEVKQLFLFIQDHAHDLDSYEAEKTIFGWIKKIGLHAMKGYFAKVGTGDIGDSIQTPEGVTFTREAMLRKRIYFSVFGKLDVPRTSYRKRGLPGIMPLDASINLPERCYSHYLQEIMNLCTIRDSFGESNETLINLLGIEISQSCLETVNRESSSKYDEFYDQKDVPDPQSEGQLQVLEFDGKGVPVIKSEAAKIQSRLGKGQKRQKKKEATVGVSFTIESQERSPEQVAENLIFPEVARKKREQNQEKSDFVKSKNIRRIASLVRSRESVMRDVVEDAKRRDPELKRPWVVVMDGALGLWSAIAGVLGGMGIEWVGVLDIIHVVEYLWKVGNSLHGEKTKASEKWVYDHLLAILQGRVGRVIGGLKQTLTKCEKTLKKSQKDAIKEVIRYFENHRQWMKYDEYLKAGYPIGSGVVESTCGHTVKNRMEGVGRRWSLDGGESMLLLRSVYTSGDWNEYWRIFRQLERERNYKKFLDLGECADDYLMQEAA